MRFLFLSTATPRPRPPLPQDERKRIVEEHMAYTTMLRDLGSYVYGDALDDPRSSVVVRPGESPIVSDGPFAETKEAVGGFYVIDVESRDRAVELAGKVPLSPGLAVEVLTIAEI